MYSGIKNLWPELIEAKNYCLKEDLDIIKAFNEKEKTRKEKYEKAKKDPKKAKDFEIRLDLIAEPFVGNPKANIIVLAANPGVSIGVRELDLYKKHPKFKTDIIKYHRDHKSITYPYYYFNPDYDAHPGYDWATARFNSLQKESEIDWKVLSNKILYLQYFPYHSKNFKNIKKGEYLECQKYTFQLLANGIDRNALIICFRCFDLWDQALKDNIRPNLSLKTYENLIVLNSAQSVYVTKNNMKENDFEKLLKALKEKK